MSTQISMKKQKNLRKLEGFYLSILAGEKPTPVKRIKEKMKLLKEKRADADYEYLGTDTKAAYGGLVHKIKVKKTGKIMAIKARRFTPYDTTTKAEIDILKSLPGHPSIVVFLGLTPLWSYVAMEHVEGTTDLQTCMKEEEAPFAIDGVNKLIKQLLQGVKFLHENGVVHGDLRPQNILITKGGGDLKLKICNFAKATRSWRWYRAPELLKERSREVDVWNVGCIMAKLVLENVGEDEEDRVREVYEILGRPAYSKTGRAKFVLGEDGFDLLKRLLSEDPRMRITAESALNHVWFHDD